MPVRRGTDHCSRIIREEIVMTSAQIIIIVTIVAYLFGMLLIGVIFNRAGAADTSDGFYIVGRSL